MAIVFYFHTPDIEKYDIEKEAIQIIRKGRATGNQHTNFTAQSLPESAINQRIKKL